MEDETRFVRAVLLVLNICTVTLRRVIKFDVPANFASFQAFLDDKDSKHSLFHLRFTKCCCGQNTMKTYLTKPQWDLLYIRRSTKTCGFRGECPCMYDTKSGVTVDELDITLCYFFIKNLFKTSYNNNVEIVREARNSLIHTEKASLDEPSYKQIWGDVENAILNLAKCVSGSLHKETGDMIKELESRLMSTSDLTNLEELIHEHCKEYQRVIIESLEKQIKLMKSKIEQNERDIAEIKSGNVDRDKRIKNLEIKNSVQDGITDEKKEIIFQNLLQINTRATEWIPTSSLQRTDKPPKFEDIYVPPTIREDLEKTEQMYRHEVNEKRTEEKHSIISSARDLFYKKGQAVRYIFLQGEAGHGKTEYCRNLVKQWCKAKQGNSEKEGLREWESGLDEFDFVFMIMLRHVQKSRTSLVDMICYDLFKHFGSCHDDIKKLIKSGNYRSLFIIDGLDEWKIPPEIRENLVNTALPDIDCTSNSTFLFSYRPWKHAELVGEIQSCDRIIEVKGFDENGKRLAIKNVLKTLKLPDSSKEIIEQKSDEIIKVSKKSGLESILGIPLLVPVFVTLCHEGKFEENSMTCFYISLVQYLIKIAKEKKSVNDSMTIDIVGKTKMSESTDGDILVPDILESSKNKTFRGFLTALTKLGKIAYNDLISSETSLVFSKEELEDTLGSSVLDFALQVGLLNQCQAPGCFDEENVSLNFFHKSIQEFLAAAHVVCQGEVATSTLCRDLSSVKVILDLSEVLKFLSGLSPSLGSVLSRHVVKICEQEHFLELRMNLENSIDLEYLFNLQYRCYLEVRNNQVVEKKYPVNTLHNTEKVTKRKVDIRFHFTVIHFNIFRVSLNEIRDLLDDVNVVTEALYVQTVLHGTENKKLETSLNKFLIRTESLRHLMLHYLSDISLQSLNKDLRYVTLSSECLYQLVTSVISSRQLQILKLMFIDIEQLSTDNSQEEVIYDRKQTFLHRYLQLLKRKTSIHKQKHNNTSRTWVDLWQILPECSDLNTLHIGLESLGDTFGRDTLLQILPNLKHLRDIRYDGRCRRSLGKEPESESIIDTIIQLPQLEKIELSRLNLTERLIRGMLKLQELSLDDVKVDSKCLGYILQLQDLQELNLSYIEIPDTDMCINVVLPNLRRLCLTNTNFGDCVLELTSECKNIENIYLRGINMSESGWRRLFTSFPTFHLKVYVNLLLITMSADSWMTFVTSILKQDKSVDVYFLMVNIDDESVRIIASCPHVKVTHENMI